MSKITVSKIACKTIGVTGLGLGIADTLKGVGRFSTRGAEDAEIEHLYDTFETSRTIENESDLANSLRKKTAEFRDSNPLPQIWGKIKGGAKGMVYMLGVNLPILASSALALVCKGFWSKLGAVGVGASLLWTILKDGFGIGKPKPI